MKLLNLFLACVSLALLAGTVEASITMNPSTIYAAASDGATGAYDLQSFPGSTIPTHTTLNAVADGSHSNTAIDWDVSSGQTILSLGMDHQRNGALNSYGQTYAYYLQFTADSNDPYELSGYYNVTDNGGASGFDFMNMLLYDANSGGDLFYNVQISNNTPNEQFTLGGTGGDAANNVIGGLTGNLIAGHFYQLYANVYTVANSADDAGGSALGNITLKIGTATATPEPMSFIVWGGLILGAVTVARRVKFLQS